MAHLLTGALSCSGNWRGVLLESEEQPYLVAGLHAVSARLGGLTRRWRAAVAIAGDLAELVDTATRIAPAIITMANTPRLTSGNSANQPERGPCRPLDPAAPARHAALRHDPRKPINLVALIDARIGAFAEKYQGLYPAAASSVPGVTSR